MSARDDALLRTIAADALIEAMVSWHGAAPARAEANDYINAIFSALRAAGYAVVPRDALEDAAEFLDMWAGDNSDRANESVWNAIRTLRAMLAAGEATP